MQIAKFNEPKDVNLWRIPLLLSIGALVLFAITVTIDLLAQRGELRLPQWVSMGGIDDARAILSAMLGAVSTVLALIFSVSLLVLSMVATLFGPRLLYRFVQDWVTQTTIGFFMGTFIYIFLVFLVTRSEPSGTFVPQVSLLTSWVVVLASFCFLVYYSHRIAVSIQNPDMVARIADDLGQANLLYRSPHALSALARTNSDPRPMVAEGSFVARQSGYVQHVDRSAIIRAATTHEAVVQLRFRPGQFVLRGEELATVQPAAKLAALDGTLGQGVKVGPHRVLKQDVEFGVAQIVEIAIRALSPAVNDTFTGVACVDYLGDALCRLLEVPLPKGEFHDAQGTLRLTEPPLMFARVAKAGFDQIRQASADNPAMLIRMLSVLGRIAAQVPSEEDRAGLQSQAAAIREMVASGHVVKVDRDDIDAALQRASAQLQARPRH